MKGCITDIQRFCVHDGPGIRTAVFLKGCPLHCRWCHNPETNSPRPQVRYIKNMCTLCGACTRICPCHTAENGVHAFNAAGCTCCMRCTELCGYGALTVWGRYVEAESAVLAALADKPFYGTDGGITVTGGEPGAQPEFTVELLRLSKQYGLNTCLETSGCFAPDFLLSAAPHTDSILFDVKDGDPERLKRNTGQNMEQLMHNLKLADSLGMNYSVRSIIIRGVNDTPWDIMLLKRIKAVLPGCRRWSLFSYHSLGQSKLEQLGRTKKDSFSAVDAEKLKMLEGILNG